MMRKRYRWGKESLEYLLRLTGQIGVNFESDEAGDGEV